MRVPTRRFLQMRISWHAQIRHAVHYVPRAHSSAPQTPLTRGRLPVTLDSRFIRQGCAFRGSPRIAGRSRFVIAAREERIEWMNECCESPEEVTRVDTRVPSADKPGWRDRMQPGRRILPGRTRRAREHGSERIRDARRYSDRTGSQSVIIHGYTRSGG